MPTYLSQAGIPLLATVTGNQAALAAGAEVNLVVTLQGLALGLVMPPVQSAVLATVMAQANEANVAYVATPNNLNPGGNSLVIKVRNVGTAAGAVTWQLAVLVIGPGQAIGM